MGNEPIRKIYHLDKINLITLRRVARIFPGQLPAVGEERPRSIPTPEAVLRAVKSL